MALYAQFDVGMPRDRRMILLGLLGRGLYIEVVMYCRENLTDGRIAAMELAHIAPDVSIATKKRLLNKMVALGSMECDGDEWWIPFDVWCRWNPTRAQVDEKRAAETQRKADYRAAKKEASVKVPPGQERTDADRDADVRDPRNTPQPQPQPQPYPKPKPSEKTSSSVLQSVPAPASDDDDEIINKIITRAAHRLAEANGATNRTGYAATCAAELATERQEIHAMLTAKPFLRTDAESAAKSYLARRNRSVVA